MPKTYSPTFKLHDRFPQLVPRTTVILHPRRVNMDPPINSSKMGGHFFWPANEPWPTCPIDGYPMTPVLQLRRLDVPELNFPRESNLFQLFWCPTQFHEESQYAPFAKIVWRTVDIPEPSNLDQYNHHLHHQPTDLYSLQTHTPTHSQHTSALILPSTPTRNMHCSMPEPPSPNYTRSELNVALNFNDNDHEAVNENDDMNSNQNNHQMNSESNSVANGIETSGSGQQHQNDMEQGNSQERLTSSGSTAVVNVELLSRENVPKLCDTYDEFTVPRICRIHPERVLEYPSMAELRVTSDVDIEAVNRWIQSTSEEDVDYLDLNDEDNNYEYSWSVSPSTKIGGYVCWIHNTDYPTCLSCGNVMRHFLSIGNMGGYGGGGSKRWYPIDNNADEATNGDGICINGGGILYIFICTSCKEWPIRCRCQR